MFNTLSYFMLFTEKEPQRMSINPRKAWLTLKSAPKSLHSLKRDTVKWWEKKAGAWGAVKHPWALWDVHGVSLIAGLFLSRFFRPILCLPTLQPFKSQVSFTWLLSKHVFSANIRAGDTFCIWLPSSTSVLWVAVFRSMPPLCIWRSSQMLAAHPK